MIVSKLVKVIFFSTLAFSVGVCALPSAASTCSCQTTCSTLKVNEPSWWDWLTDQDSSQFHFFDLIELLHKEDARELSVKQNKFEEKRQAKS